MLTIAASNALDIDHEAVKGSVASKTNCLPKIGASSSTSSRQLLVTAIVQDKVPATERSFFRFALHTKMSVGSGVSRCINSRTAQTRESLTFFEVQHTHTTTTTTTNSITVTPSSKSVATKRRGARSFGFRTTLWTTTMLRQKRGACAVCVASNPVVLPHPLFSASTFSHSCLFLLVQHCQ